MTLEICIFANSRGRWAGAAKRLRAQAVRYPFVEHVTIFDESWLADNPELTIGEHSDWYGTRGFGYWRWKPLLIAERVRKSASEFVLYLDAGSELHRSAQAIRRFMFYIDWTRENDLLLMRAPESIKRWCKTECSKALGYGDASLSDIPKINSGAILVRSGSTVPLLDQWLTLSRSRGGILFDDSCDRNQQAANFIEHRHDQAVLSLLAFAYEVPLLPDETYFGDGWSGAAKDFPIWMMRNPYRFSLQPGTRSGNLYWHLKRLRDRARIGLR